VEESLKTAPKKGEDASARSRRTAEYTLGDNVSAAVQVLNEEKVAVNLPQPVVSPLSTVLERFANLEKTLGLMAAVNEGELQGFLASGETPLSRLLAVEVPAVAASKKELEQLARKHSQCQSTLDKEQRKLDKMQNAVEEEAMLTASSGSGSVGGGQAVDPEALAAQRDRKERVSHDLDVLAKDVQLEQDRLASTLLTLTARENRYAQTVCEVIRIRRKFYENAFKTIDAELPNIERLLEETNVRPVFGEKLEDHLNATGREIAFPIALAVTYLLDTGLEDEGLFRISAKQVKIDKFKAAVDSRSSLAEMLTDNDPHLHASILKSYLRELPEPLLGGGSTYDLWLRASKLTSASERLAAYAAILDRERSSQARRNIQFVIKFLHTLSEKSEETKMTPRNISIVVGPTLLWSNRMSLTSGRDANAAATAGGFSELMEHGNLESVIAVVAELIENYSDIFDGGMDLTRDDDEDVAEVRMEALKLAEASQRFDGQACYAPSSQTQERLHPPPQGASALASSSASLALPPAGGPVRGTPYPTASGDSPSPNQRRKPSIRGMGGRLMNNPVGRNIMSKINPHSAPASPSSLAAPAASSPTLTAARRSLADEDDVRTQQEHL